MLKESICPEHSSKQFKIENKNTLSLKTSIPTSCKGKSIQGTEINLSLETRICHDCRMPPPIKKSNAMVKEHVPICFKLLIRSIVTLSWASNGAQFYRNLIFHPYQTSLDSIELNCAVDFIPRQPQIQNRVLADKTLVE